MNERLDLARLAAYIDGEGCIYIRKAYRTTGATADNPHVLIVTVSNTDERLANWCKAKFGGRVNGNTWKLHHTQRRPQFVWQINDDHAAAILRSCMQYMVIKKEQAEVAVFFSRVRKSPDKTLQQRIALRDECREAIHQLKGMAHPSLETASEFCPQIINLGREGPASPQIG